MTKNSSDIERMIARNQAAPYHRADRYHCAHCHSVCILARRSHANLYLAAQYNDTRYPANS